MSWPQPTRKDHHTFCRVEQWQPVRDARGRTGTRHVTYELDLPDGRILRTRTSHPVDRSDYGPRLWQHIAISFKPDDEVFWSCVRDGIKPDRGAPVPPPEALPAELVHLLIYRVGVPEPEVARMTKPAAIARVQRYWSDGS